MPNNMPRRVALAMGKSYGYELATELQELALTDAESKSRRYTARFAT